MTFRGGATQGRCRNIRSWSELRARQLESLSKF